MSDLNRMQTKETREYYLGGAKSNIAIFQHIAKSNFRSKFIYWEGDSFLNYLSHKMFNTLHYIIFHYFRLEINSNQTV